MKRYHLNDCTIAYEFDALEGFLTYCYLIEKDTAYYVVDTFCGPVAMALVAEDMVDGAKKIVVINTHFHWDHIWGNSFFSDATIIAHETTTELIEATFDEQLMENKKFMMGRVVKAEPTVTFKRQYVLEEGLTLFYTPGHTVDSSSVYDSDTGVLIAGDNLELPLIYLENKDIDSYIATLNFYQSLKTTWIASGHTLKIDSLDIEEFKKYLYNVKNGVAVSFSDPDKQKVHEINKTNIKETF